MNFRLVSQQLGLLLLVLSGILLVLVGVDLLLWRDDTATLQALLAAAGVGLVAGALMFLLRFGAPRHIGRREALLLVATSWGLGAALAALPFFFWAHFSDAGVGSPFRNYADCYFESMSGLTTTGATVLKDIDTLPDALLLWRSLTHWLGGLGIVVLFVAVLPMLGVGGKRLFQVEAAGPSHEGVRPHIRETARVLWYVYLGLTFAAFGAFFIATEMDLFDSLNHALSMMSTGGLSTRDASLGHYDSSSVDFIASFFMLVAGINFALFYQMTQGKWRLAWSNIELRVYLILKIVVIAIVTVNLLGTSIVSTTGRVLEDASWFNALRHATFATVTWQTGTGFGAADYDLFPYLSKALLVGLMFVGGCAGSTAGGVKVVRLWIVLKILAAEIEKAFRPDVVRPIRLGSVAIAPELKLASLAYVLGFFFTIGIGAVLVQVVEGPDGQCGYLESLTASLSCLSNVGPGLGEVGATNNYGWFSTPAKIILCVLMALGRLEFFAILVLFTPRYWRGN